MDDEQTKIFDKIRKGEQLSDEDVKAILKRARQEKMQNLLIGIIVFAGILLVVSFLFAGMWNTTLILLIPGISEITLGQSIFVVATLRMITLPIPHKNEI